MEVVFQRTPPSVAVTGIMGEEGLYNFLMKEKSIKKEDHWAFLRDFRERLGHDREVALFYDGLSFHKSTETKRLLKSLGIVGLMNKAYSSELNPIEQIWQEAKYLFRRRLLRFLSEHEGEELDLFDMVH